MDLTANQLNLEGRWFAFEEQCNKTASVVEKLYSQGFIGLPDQVVVPFFDNRKPFSVSRWYDTLLKVIGICFQAALIEKEVYYRPTVFELKQKVIVVDKNKIIIGVAYLMAELFEKLYDGAKWT
jgi:hypothetical protein